MSTIFFAMEDIVMTKDDVEPIRKTTEVFRQKATKAEESANETSASETSPTITEPQVTEWVAPKVTAVAVPRGKNHPLDSDWAA